MINWGKRCNVAASTDVEVGMNATVGPTIVIATSASANRLNERITFK